MERNMFLGSRDGDLGTSVGGHYSVYLKSHLGFPQFLLAFQHFPTWLVSRLSIPSVSQKALDVVCVAENQG